MTLEFIFAGKESTYLLPFLTLLLRYLIFAGGFYFVFYVWKTARWRHRKIQSRFPGTASIRREILYSLSTIVVFSLLGILIFKGNQTGIFHLSFEPVSGHILPILSSFILLVFCHDTWFYWTHRLMHHRLIFRHVHAIHHKSHNPTPWAAFAFHPIEALVEAGFFPICLALFHIHFLGFFAFMLYMIVFNVLGHLGFEILPAALFRSRLGTWQNSSTHHNMHHQMGRHNFGLYFNFWDRLMGTNHPDYEKKLEEVLGREK